jgi:hypothetical protein
MILEIFPNVATLLQAILPLEEIDLTPADACQGYFYSREMLLTLFTQKTKTMKTRKKNFRNFVLPFAAIAAACASPQVRAESDTSADGYLCTYENPVPETFDGGFSIYVAAYPMLDKYPGSRMQSGLFGTWMFPKGLPEGSYSDIEGGLGWWNDTRFGTETPKFIMGGVGTAWSDIANGPSHGAGTWEDPRGLYGVAQLSPWLLFPIDGLNLKQGTNGELFGYGYLPLPLSPAKPTTNGKNVVTGENSWTLFLNTQNFKGPVCFFTPYFWSRCAVDDPKLVGHLLDTQGSNSNKSFQMETQYIPAAIERANGLDHARIAPWSFPVGAGGSSVLLHRPTCYNKSALWDKVQTWFNGGSIASSAFQASGAYNQTFQQAAWQTWKIIPYSDVNGEINLNWDSFATPYLADPYTFGYKWNSQLTTLSGPAGSQKVTIPQYYTRSGNTWNPSPASQAPNSLKARVFGTPDEGLSEPYTTPTDAGSPFKSPGPVAGPFQAHLGDHSVVTYYWYRFADQPAMMRAGLTSAEREKIQLKVRKLHRRWKKDGTYLAAPTLGSLASIDPALVLTPPAGLEIGYVPIATRQEADPTNPK